MTKKELQEINKEYQLAVTMWDHCWNKSDVKGTRLYSIKKLHFEQLMDAIGYKLNQETNEFYKQKGE